MTITEFLLARIAEDEATARGALGMNWDGSAYQQVRTYCGDDPHYYKIASGQVGLEHWEPKERHAPGTTFKHIARHDPARVLAECAAKRAIIGEHEPARSMPPHKDMWPREYHWLDADGRLILKKGDLVIVTEGGREIERMSFEQYWGRFPAVTEAPAKELRALAAVYADHPDYRQEWAL